MMVFDKPLAPTITALLILICLFCQLYESVKREDFKTCAQSGFCTRQRNTQSGQVNFHATLKSIVILNDGAVIQFPLFHDTSNTEFVGKLTCLADSTFRFQILEKKPPFERYIPNEALKKEGLLLKRCVIEHHDDHRLQLINDRFQLLITSKPFVILIQQDNENIITFNSNGLLNFETFDPIQKSAENHDKNTMHPNDNSPPFDEDVVEDINTSPSCAENFRGHHDSNPYCHTSVGVDITFWNTHHVYGIPEHADRFKLHSTCKTDPYRLHNMDVCNYEVNNQMALYGSVPYMISHSTNHTNAILWLNAAETWVDINYTDHHTIIQSLIRRLKSFFKPEAETTDAEARRVQTRWFSEAGNIDVFFLLGPAPNDVFRQYALLTGTTNLPPMFSLGYHQSRWNYFSEEEVYDLHKKIEYYDFPCDVLWLDIEYTNGKRYFTWNNDKFPNPIDMTNYLASFGRKLVVIVDPHIKDDNYYHISKEIHDLGFTIKQSDGKTDYKGNCWPGSSTYIDFFNPKAREWYIDQYSFEKFPGTTLNTHLWNDMNEPSVFSGPEITIHKDVIHFDGRENREIHNIYGFLMHLSTWDALVKRNKHEIRPFILSRSFFAGSQRAGAVWTGDNTNDYEHLKISIPMLLSLSVSGISFCGADVGGFFDSSKSPELFYRWFQAAVFQPFVRVHSHIESIRREPWAFDEKTFNLMKYAVELRYSMIPFWYTLFFENEKNGAPPMRPLWSVFPKDDQVFDIETAYMLGEHLLISPVLDSKVTEMSIYLPSTNEIWYDESFKAFDGGEYVQVSISELKIPRFQRGGTILPYKNRKRRSTKAMIHDPYTLYVALDRKNFAQGTIFMDDGESFNYKQNNSFYYRKITFSNNVITSRLIGGKRTFKTNEWIEKIVVIGLTNMPKHIYINYAKLSSEWIDELTFFYKDVGKMLVIRKPGVNANFDWNITIS